MSNNLTKYFTSPLCNAQLVLLCSIVTFLSGCANSHLSELDPSKITVTEQTSTSTFGLFDITTFDIYTNNNTLHLLMGGKVSATNKQSALLYTYSENGGKTWIEPITITPTAKLINIRGNDVQLAANDASLMAIWQSKGELPGMGPLTSAFSQDAGNTWIIGANPAANKVGDQSHSDLLSDKQGNFHTVWLEDPEENGYQSLRYAQTPANSAQWSKALTLDNSTCSCCWNTLVLAPDQTLNILYRDMKPRDMMLIRSTDNGASWQPRSIVGAFNWHFEGCPHVGGALAFAPQYDTNFVHALVWTGLENQAGLYYLKSNDHGNRWSAPKPIGNTAIHGDITVSQTQVMAVWDEMEATGSRIYFAKSSDNGETWSPPVRISQSNITATHPRLVLSHSGFLALWTEKPAKEPSRLAWRMLE